ncbi:MAG TPA: MlaD family protein [Candidatus Binatia bacterium]|jgi:phospholipid/cholesterol/gamma-HCH transport system substrate-binding protein/paraquat-inducible protein B
MEKFSYFKIGIFVISAVVIGVIGVVVLGVGTVFQKKALVETYIDESVQGLDVGSPVKFRGVPVGRVEQISLTSAEYPTRRQYVLVRIQISSNMFQFPINDPNAPALKSELARGFRIRLAPQGLTGVAYLEADYLDPERNPPLAIDWQPAYPYIPSTTSRITQLSEAVERILRNIGDIDISQLTQSMEKSLAAMTKLAESANLEKIGGQANSLLGEVRETNRQINALVSNPDLKSALADASVTAGRARQIIERAEKPVNQLLADMPQATESLNRLVKRLDSVANDLPQTSAELRQTIQRMNRLIANQQRDIEQTMSNLRAISENMKEITENSKKYPSQVLFGGPPPPAKAMQR